MTAAENHTEFIDKMNAARLPRKAIDTFCHNLELFLHGGSGMLTDDEIQPVSSLRDAETLDDHEAAGRALLSKTVVIKLNGGLGTGMGLHTPKSLIEVRDGLTFLDLIARQILQLRDELGVAVPLLMMNSHHTREATLELLARYPGIGIDTLPIDFLQHRVPKVDADTYRPARFQSDPDMEWCPPGHGDIYSALLTSGTLFRLIDYGIEYAFVSNADNLGAIVDARLLGFMAGNSIDFMMEAADRTDSDRKGGHLCFVKGAGLALRELGQCPPGDRRKFQNISKYKYFNTNNLWIHLPSLAALLDHHHGILPLAPIFNRKTIDPRDPESPPVIQIETAMGSALSLFRNATAIRVPRHRFSPVKSTTDLLAIRSDAYVLTPDYRVIQRAPQAPPPAISLDDRYFKMLDDFNARFHKGPPSLVNCHSLAVRGDISFGGNVRIEGHTHLAASGGPKRVPDGATLTGRVAL